MLMGLSASKAFMEMKRRLLLDARWWGSEESR